MFELFESLSTPSADSVSYMLMICLGIFVLIVIGLGIWLGLTLFHGES